MTPGSIAIAVAGPPVRYDYMAITTKMHAEALLLTYERDGLEAAQWLRDYIEERYGRRMRDAVLEEVAVILESTWPDGVMVEGILASLLETN